MLSVQLQQFVKSIWMKTQDNISIFHPFRIVTFLLTQWKEAPLVSNLVWDGVKFGTDTKKSAVPESSAIPEYKTYVPFLFSLFPEFCQSVLIQDNGDLPTHATIEM